MSTTPPNWYPDPEDPSQERWWDGMAWTDHRRPVAEAAAQSPQSDATGDGAPPPPIGGAWDAPSTPPPGQAPTGEPVLGQGLGQAGMGQAGMGAGAKVSPFGVPLADPGKRLGAILLDGLIAFGWAIAVFLPAAMITAVLGRLGSFGGILAVIVLIGGVVAAVAVTWLITVMAEGRTGQTYGKHIMDIATVGHDSGRPIGSGAAFGRGIIRSIGSSIYLLFLGVLWILWDDKRQGWHDKALKTLVVQHPTTTLNPIAFAQYVWKTPPPR